MFKIKLRVALSLLYFFAPSLLFALDCTADNQLMLGCILTRQITKMTYIIQFLLALAYISGYGFIIAAIFKFKQVRENPQQVPVSTPFAFLLTALLLIFMPGLIQYGGNTLFNLSPENQIVGLDGNRFSNIAFISTAIPLASNPTTLGNDSTLFGMVRRTTDLFPSMALIIVSTAYIAGLGFAVAALFKMKAVRDAPQQNPITVPLSYLVVSVLLIFMNDIIAPTAETLFGSSENKLEGGAAGQNYSAIIKTGP